MVYQQGDVLITQVGQVQGRTLDHKRLADGEATGHAHVATAEDAMLYEDNGVLYLDAPTGTEIVHEEHGTVTVPPGQYQIGIVREYSHFDEEARNVAD